MDDKDRPNVRPNVDVVKGLSGLDILDGRVVAVDTTPPLYSGLSGLDTLNPTNVVADDDDE